MTEASPIMETFARSTFLTDLFDESGRVRACLRGLADVDYPKAECIRRNNVVTA
jgi:hypothetical protein